MDNKNVKVFAAGPINGARSWRLKVITDIYNKLLVSIKVIPPRSQPCILENLFDKLVKVEVYNPQDILPKEDFTKEIHNSQIEWETKYLDMSEILLFYIPEQEEETEGYAKTTRFELSEHLSKIFIFTSLLNEFKKNQTNMKIPHLILYINESFSGEYYIIKRINDMYKKNKIFSDYVHIANTHDEFISISSDIIKKKLIEKEITK